MQFQKIFRSLIVLIFTTQLFTACDSSKEERDLGMLPSSKGDVGELIMVMDSVYWNSEIGDTIRSIFRERVDGILQGEPMFTVRYVRPYQFKGLLREHRNLVLLTTFDKNSSGNAIMQKFFTPESVEKIKTDPNYFFIPQTDQFASDQLVLQIFSATQEQLLQKLSEPQVKDRIQSLMNQTENERVKKRLFSSKGAMNNDMMKVIKEKHDFQLSIPSGYQLAKDSTGILWLRLPEAAFDKNLVIAYKKYESESQFSNENLLEWREEIGKKHLKDPEYPERYVYTEMQEPPVFSEIQLNGKYAKKMQGIWRINTRFVGGSFVSFILTSEDNQYIFYLEGLLNAPGMKKRELLRELVAILSTFKA